MHFENSPIELSEKHVAQGLTKKHSINYNRIRAYPMGVI
ncbi:MAG: hypothetical protein K0Q65_1643 [Clostridia bacterium]|nr:hypothetical protein [Clostridia bacterium]